MQGRLSGVKVERYRVWDDKKYARGVDAWRWTLWRVRESARRDGGEASVAEERRNEGNACVGSC